MNADATHTSSYRPTTAALCAAAALVVSLSLVLGSCAIAGAGSSSRGPDTLMTSGSPMLRNGTGEQRTDLTPVTSRFELLASAGSATWLSGTLGDDSVPGPSIYWIDAIVTLPESDFQRLVSDYEAVDATTAPTVESPLDEQLPDGEYLASPALDAAFSRDTFRSTVHLSADGRTLVLRSVFQ